MLRTRRLTSALAAGGKHAIHTVGPRLSGFTWDAAVQTIALAYHNVLSEFARCDVPTLRLLPISGGIFAASFRQDMPRLTREALEIGIRALSTAELTAVQGRTVYMCVFEEQELAAFVAAFGSSQEAA
jgi:O-acetyl-ADP-ribose deacetylase (regulator of RNase III)